MSPPNHLLALAALGFVSLWGAMWVNGTLEGLFQIRRTSQFPDGRPIRTQYTGFPVIDSLLVILIAFFDLVSDAKAHPAAPWLLFDLCNTLGAVNTWVLIESRRRGVRNLFLRHTIIFIFLWNTFGAAFVTPIYFYFIALSNHTTRDATIPLNEARAFPMTLVANALFPLLMFIPGSSDHERQGFIALYSLTPIFMVVCIVVCSRPGTTLTNFATIKDEKRPNADAPWIIASLWATGILAATQHLYTIAGTILAPSDAHLTLTRVFVPSPDKVFSSPRGSQIAMVEGAHLFTQLDWLVTAAACVAFTHYLLCRSSSGKQENNTACLAWIILAIVFLGPAAAGSFALVVREKRLRTEVEAQTAVNGPKSAKNGIPSSKQFALV